jgi:hypothetical protein
VAHLHLQLHMKRPLMEVCPHQLRPVAGAVALSNDVLDHHLPQTACIPSARAMCIAHA